MSYRFVVIHSDDAWERRLPGADQPGSFDSWWSVWECDDAGKPIREVGSDRGEPEDKLLVRDFQWVAEELNYQASAFADAEQRAREAETRQKEAEQNYLATIAQLSGDLREEVEKAASARTRAETLAGALRGLHSICCQVSLVSGPSAQAFSDAVRTAGRALAATGAAGETTAHNNAEREE